MKPIVALGVFVLAASTALAAPQTAKFVLQGPEIPSVDGATSIDTQLVCDAEDVPTALLISRLVAEIARGHRIPGNGAPPELNAACPSTHACECGVPTFDPFDLECTVGFNTCETACKHLQCPNGQTIHIRTCPCEGTGCNDHWTAYYCGDVACGECDTLCG